MTTEISQTELSSVSEKMESSAIDDLPRPASGSGSTPMAADLDGKIRSLVLKEPADEAMSLDQMEKMGGKNWLSEI
ncbi:hypothetical protein Droror1_Dr00016742 [Drosera rotundifolia]